MTDATERTRLMLVIEAGGSSAERLQAALSAADIASVVICAPPGGQLDAATASPLIGIAQKAGTAALLYGDARLARTLKADGAHLPVSETAEAAYAEARDILGQRFVVGVDAGHSKHDAMSVGEAGAEYVGFGVPIATKEREIARERQLDLVSWWAEVFEVPCVAFDVDTPELAEAMALAGADFIAVTLEPGASPVATRDRIKAFADAIAVRHSFDG